jgi:NADH-quinone oxidoreductase subunit A
MKEAVRMAASTTAGVVFGSALVLCPSVDHRNGTLEEVETGVTVPSPTMPAGVAHDFNLATYYPIFLYLLAVLAFAGLSLLMAHLPFLKPQRRTVVKLMPYESGMDPIGDARQHFDVKFYLIAILFLVFDVELLFLYPWVVVAYREPPQQPLLPAEFSRPVFWEVLVFLFTLVVAYIYAWRKGVFRWR